MLALMGELRSVEFQHPEARRLADLVGVSHDLMLVGEYCQQYYAHDRFASTEEMIICRSLFIAATVGYCRTLGSSVRSGVTQEQILQLPQQLQETHQYFKSLRDKYVAHSVNAFEENHVKVWLVPPEAGSPAIASIGHCHNELATPSMETMIVLEDLAQNVLKLVKAEMETEQARLYKLAASLPLEYFLGAPEPKPPTGFSQHPSKSRKRIG